MPLLQTLIKLGFKFHIIFVLCTSWTALHLSSAKGLRDVVEFLLNRGSNVNAKTVKQVTPLMLAAYSGDSVTVKLLLNKQSDLDNQCYSG